MPDVTITITISTDDTAQGRQEPHPHGAAPSLPATPLSRMVVAEATLGPAREAIPLPLEQLGGPVAPTRSAGPRPADLAPPEASASQATRTPKTPSDTAEPEDIKPPPKRKAPAKPRTRAKTTK